MSNNPFSKIPTPSKVEPRNISISDFSKFQSYQVKKIASSLRTYRKSLLYIGGCLGFSLVLGWLAGKKAHSDLFGNDNQGGSYLNMRTYYDEDHYAYNRQFQRMNVLGEAKIGDLSRHSKKLITDLGVQLPQAGSPHIPKKAPHEKYY